MNNENEKQSTEIFKDIERRTTKVPDLIINNVPRNTLNKFINMAQSDDFGGNYGFTLKHLIDFYEGIVPLGTEHLEQEIIAIKQELQELRQNQTPAAEEPKGKRMCDGTSRG